MKLPFPLSLSSKKDLKNNFSEKFKDLNSQTVQKSMAENLTQCFGRKTFEATIKLLCRKEKKDKNNLVWHSKF